MACLPRETLSRTQAGLPTAPPEKRLQKRRPKGRRYRVKIWGSKIFAFAVDC
jgi:hypothetical protein